MTQQSWDFLSHLIFLCCLRSPEIDWPALPALPRCWHYRCPPPLVKCVPGIQTHTSMFVQQVFYPWIHLSCLRGTVIQLFNTVCDNGCKTCDGNINIRSCGADVLSLFPTL
ncbi:mCG1051111 [Mus musculus]|nr:mCG1051111 [Mus musculus]